MRSSRSGDLASAALSRRCRLAGPRRCRRLFLVGARRGSARLERGELKEAHQRRRRGRAPPAPTRRRALATRPRPGPRYDDKAASRDLATARPPRLATATLRSSAWPRPCRLVCCCVYQYRNLSWSTVLIIKGGPGKHSLGGKIPRAQSHPESHPKPTQTIFAKLRIKSEKADAENHRL